MDHSVLTILDLGIIAAYLVIMVLVGVYSVRRIQNTKDYYVAGRSSWRPSAPPSSAAAV